MDEFGTSQFEGIGNTIRKKRSRTSRRPRPEAQLFLESRDRSLLSSTSPSDDVNKASSDDIAGYDGNSKRKVFNLNQCASRSVFVTKAEGEYSQRRIKKEDSNGFLGDGGNQGHGSLHSQTGDGIGNENKLKKVKLKVGGVTRTIQTKSSSHDASDIGSLTKSARSSDAPRPRQKLILQDISDEDHSPPNKKVSFQGTLWKDSTSGSSAGKEDSYTGKMPIKNVSGKQGEKSEAVRKSKRVPKRRVLDEAFNEDDEDDEIRYLEKLKTSKVAAGYKDVDEESTRKQRSLSRVSKGGKYEISEDFGPSRSGNNGKRSRSDRLSEDTDYEEEELVSDRELEGKKKKLTKDLPDSPTENKRELTLTTRQRALLSGKDTSSVSGGGLIEFPNGLPPPPPRKQKERLTEVEQQLKKAEAAQRRRMQNEKAARESEAEAIRKILGQDSSRKKREAKLKKRQEELAQEKAANAEMLASNTIRTIMGPTGTVVTFPKDMGLPRIFYAQPSCYPPPREKCAGPSCTNPYKYRDSKSKLPLCSLHCYKAIHEMTANPETAC